MLNSRESLAQRIANLGEGILKDLLTDLNDSAWQWSRKSDDSSTRNRKTIIGGQVASSSSSTASSSGSGSGSGSGSSSGTGDPSSGSITQVQSDWKVSDTTSLAFIKNKPDIGAVIDDALNNSPYAVWFSNSVGKLVGTDSFTFGDPTRLGALYTPSLQVMGSAIMGNRAGFWDDQFFTMSYQSTGATVQLTPGYSSTKFIYAHNSQNNASVVTDKASFANLAQDGVVFASMLPHTSEDLIYLHTDEAIKYDSTTKTLSVENLICYGNSNSGTLLVMKASHGFSAGMPLHISVDELGNTTWDLAQATNDLSKIATHFVVSLVNEDSFRVANFGFWAIPGLTVYGPLLLGATAGGVVSSVSALPSNVAIQPLGIADATGLHINITSYVRDVTP